MPPMHTPGDRRSTFPRSHENKPNGKSGYNLNGEGEKEIKVGTLQSILKDLDLKM
jgi:hypothetical protein